MNDSNAKAHNPSIAGVSEQQLADHAVGLLRAHDLMLSDSVRNRAFYEALKRRVTPGLNVLDLGAGTGIWSVAAALLGAKKVVAVEADPMMIGMITRLAAECGVGERVHPVCGFSHQIRLDREFDLVVSETIGFDGFEEQIVPIMIDARARFLREGGRIIPETVALVAAAAHYQPLQDPTPRGVPFSFPHFKNLRLNASIRLREPRRLRLLTKPQRLLDVDLADPPPAAVIESMKAAWPMADASEVNCFAVWVESRLAAGVRLSTRRTTSWAPVLYPIEPMRLADVTLELDLCLGNNIQWQASVYQKNGPTLNQLRSPVEGARGLPPPPRIPDPAIDPKTTGR